MFDSLKAFRAWVDKWQSQSELLGRIIRATGLVIIVFAVGTLGYYVLSPPSYSFLDSAYMTTITLTTVGFGETIEVEHDPVMQVYTIVLIILGSGAVLYFASTVIEFVVSREFQKILDVRKQRKKIDKLDNHFIVAGLGNTGEYVLNEVHRSARDCVVIDHNLDRIEEVRGELAFGFPYVLGDALDDENLLEAGLERADALICSLGNDRDNLFVTISADHLIDDLKIITRGNDPASEEKFYKAGATSVIYTNVLGGRRMAAEAIRPEVTTFLDLMMREEERDHSRRVEEIPIPDGSPLIGQTIADTGIREYTDALIIAVYDERQGEPIFNPASDYEMDTNTELIVLTLLEDVETIEAIVRGDYRA